MTGVKIRRDDEIHMPLNERPLGSNAPQQVGQAGGQGKPDGHGRPTCAWWNEQALYIGRQVQALVAHQQDTDPIPAQVTVCRDVLLASGCILLVGNILIANEMI
jgi:hypothetical protein